MMRFGTTLVACAAVATFAACFSPESVTCGQDGPTCPQGWMCTADNLHCINPAVTRCGDGVQDPGEACDDGNLDNHDGCNYDCTLPTCGDGLIDGDEVCDDGNNANGDLCSADCKSLEFCGDHYPNRYTHIDKDGNTVDPEECDEGGVDTATCNADCTKALCGDGKVNAANGESCDGGSPTLRVPVDTPECNKDCSFTACGDTYVNMAAGEGCDPGSFCSDGDPINNIPPTPCTSSEDCTGVSGDQECKPRDSLCCTASCHIPTCGNGVTEGKGIGKVEGQTCELVPEVCDDGKQCDDDPPTQCTTADDCIGIGDGSCKTRDADGCSANCLSTEECGNKIIDRHPHPVVNDHEVCVPFLDRSCPTDFKGVTALGQTFISAEICDKGRRCADGTECTEAAQCVGKGDNGTCKPRDGFGCSSDCLSIEVCGDGYVNPGEVCDDGNQLDTDPITGLSDGCSANCKSTGQCGNGEIDVSVGEECDDGPLNGTALSPNHCGIDCTTLKCGNARKDTGEQCDEGTIDDTVDPPVVTSTNADTARCLTSCVCNVCGDKKVNNTVGSSPSCPDSRFEECDGGAVNTLTCNFDCTLSVCGDHVVNFASHEVCDNGPGLVAGQTAESETCNTNCTLAFCGDGIVNASRGEVCDDGNIDDGDGCSANCRSTEKCGDGVVNKAAPFLEVCDDGSSCDDGQACTTDDECSSGECKPRGGDGCSEDCHSTEICGDGYLNDYDPYFESCDDGNTDSGDGCTGDSCVLETGWTCDPVGAACKEICGDELVLGAEGCDEGSLTPSGGCTSCKVGEGWDCPAVVVSGQLPKTGGLCTPHCGDRLVRGVETCDDGNTDPEDGCGASCEFEPGWVCPTADGIGGTCLATCGDGLIVGLEQCDDGDTVSGNGCDSGCRKEVGWDCPATVKPGEIAKEGGVCTPHCGDGIVRGDETCDEGTATASGGCVNCQVESGWTCTPGKTCKTTCGDGIQAGAEECDLGVGNNNNGDCTSGCKIATCDDGLLHSQGTAPFETDVDCGGGDCPLCLVSDICADRADCGSNFCNSNFRCAVAARVDDLFAMSAATTSISMDIVADLLVNDEDALPDTFSLIQGDCGEATVAGDTVTFTPGQGTTITPGSDSVELSTAGTINVASTAGFVAAGTITVETSDGPQAVTYTSTTATTFEGATGGAGTMVTGGAVTQSLSPGLSACAPPAGSGMPFTTDFDYQICSVTSPGDPSLCSDATVTVSINRAPKLMPVDACVATGTESALINVPGVFTDVDGNSIDLTSIAATPAESYPYSIAGKGTATRSGGNVVWTPLDKNLTQTYEVPIRACDVPFGGPSSTSASPVRCTDDNPASQNTWTVRWQNAPILEQYGDADAKSLVVSTSGHPSTINAPFVGANGAYRIIKQTTPSSATIKVAAFATGGAAGFGTTVTTPAGGTCTVNANDVSYTAPTSARTDSCYVQACESCGGTYVCSITRLPFVVVAAPVAVADARTVLEGTVTPFTTADLAANDSNYDLSTFALVGSGPAAGCGSVALAAGTVSYTAPTAPSACGVATFDYKVCSALDPVVCSTATVTVTINRAPIVTPPFSCVSTGTTRTNVNLVPTYYSDADGNPIGTLSAAGAAGDATLGFASVAGSVVTWAPNDRDLAHRYAVALDACDNAAVPGCAPTATWTAVWNDPPTLGTFNGGATRPLAVSTSATTTFANLVIDTGTVTGLPTGSIDDPIASVKVSKTRTGTYAATATTNLSGSCAVDPSTRKVTFTAGTTTGTDQCFVQVCEVCGVPGTCAVTELAFTVVPAPVITPATYTLAVGNTMTFSGTGGILPYVFSVPSGGGSVDAAGLYTAPGAPGTAVVRLTDAQGNTSDANVTINAALAISPSTTTLAVTNTLTFTQSGGVSPFTFSVDSGGAGGTINASTGLYTAPAATGQDTVRVTDARGNTSTATVTINAALAISPTTTILAVNNTQTFTRTGGVGPFTYSVVAGGAGGTINASTGLYTAPATVGSGSDTVRVTDFLNNTAEATVTLNNALAITPTTKQLAVNNTATFHRTGGVAPFTFSVDSGGAGGTIDPTSGLYTAPASPGSDTVRVTDSLGNTATAAVSIGGALAISPPTFTLAVTNQTTFSATGGVAPFTYSIVSGGGTIDGSTGVYTAPATVGSGTATVRVTDSLSNTAEATVTINEALTISPTSYTLAVENTTSFTHSGGVAPFTYAVVTGGGTIDASGLYTAPATAGTATVRVTDARNNTADAAVTIEPALTISPASITLAVNNTTTFTTTGGVGTVSFAVTAGAGTINGTTGEYTAPASPGTDTVRATDSLGNISEATVTVGGALGISPASIVLAVTNQTTFTATGGVAPFTYSITAGDGSIDGTTGVYTAPAAPGTATVTVTDSLSNTAEASVTINEALVISPTTVTVPVGGTTTFSTTGGAGGVVYSVQGGGAGGGFITSTPGEYTAPSFTGTDTVIATDAMGNTASAVVTIATVPDAPTNVVGTRGNEIVNVAWDAPSSDGGSPISSYTVTSSPGSFTCTATAPATTCDVTGLTNGTAYSFTVTATNSVGDSSESDASAPVTPQQP